MTVVDWCSNPPNIPAIRPSIISGHWLLIHHPVQMWHGCDRDPVASSLPRRCIICLRRSGSKKKSSLVLRLTLRAPSSSSPAQIPSDHEPRLGAFHQAWYGWGSFRLGPPSTACQSLTVHGGYVGHSHVNDILRTVGCSSEA